MLRCISDHANEEIVAFGRRLAPQVPVEKSVLQQSSFLAAGSLLRGAEDSMDRGLELLGPQHLIGFRGIQARNEVLYPVS